MERPPSRSGRRGVAPTIGENEQYLGMWEDGEDGVHAGEAGRSDNGGEYRYAQQVDSGAWDAEDLDVEQAPLEQVVEDGVRRRKLDPSLKAPPLFVHKL